MTISDAFTDLTADGEELENLLATLPDQAWDTPTPAEGWTVAHQIAHLAATFKLAGLAAADAERFEALKSRLSPDFQTNVDLAMAPYLALTPAALLARFHEERVAADKALAAVPEGQPVPWLVRPLPATVLAAAGMMELFGHGQDVYDGLGVQRQYTDRVGHVAFFGTRTWDFGYQARGLATPDVAFRFVLTAPSGREWVFGPADAEQTISGPAVDFCLLVTRRRHSDDHQLTAVGEEAAEWLTVAQAYRGPAGPGRRPGQFAAAAA
ncbi:MAG: TIGR03084 family protein [Hamadaea sp.]|nr:TIGR03084 family protein [Hamadaea sp.]